MVILVFFLSNHKNIITMSGLSCPRAAHFPVSVCNSGWKWAPPPELPDTLNSLAMFSIKRQLAHKVDSNDFATKKVCASYSCTHNLYFSMQMKADIIVLLVRKTVCLLSIFQGQLKGSSIHSCLAILFSCLPGWHNLPHIAGAVMVVVRQTACLEGSLLWYINHLRETS